MMRQTTRQMHSLTLPTGVFLFIYGRLVCPFMDSLDAAQLITGLGIVAVIHVALRELALALWGTVPTARRGYVLSLLTWGLAGLVALLVHALRYPDFPIDSHIKLLAGYWLLGGGVMAQLEYTLLERRLRRQGESLLGQARAHRDRLGRRLMESFLVFTAVPAIGMVLLIVRYVIEGFADPIVVGEVAFMALVLTLGAVLVAWNYGQTLREDTENIVAGLEHIATGQLDIHLDDSRADELGRVAEGINEMTNGLRLREQIREAFGRFVSPLVAEAVIRDFSPQPQEGGKLRLGGQRRIVTVVLADLRGFTPLTETLPPNTLTALLNGHFSAMVEVIHAHGGLVDKFMGDSVMAVFGLSGDPDTHPAHALDCAQALLARTQADNAARLSQGFPALTLGIGLQTGPVVAGTLGSPDRLEFTVIGEAVNIAARLQDMARAPNPPLLLGAETAQAVPPTRVRPLGPMALRGMSKPVEVFTLCHAGDAGQDQATG